MTLSSLPEPADIWLAYLRFSDNPKVGKVRPVLILDRQGEEFEPITAICLKITSRTASDGRQDIAIADWQSCGLRKPSFARLDQIFEIAPHDLLRDRRIGTMAQPEFAQIIQRLKEMERRR